MKSKVEFRNAGVDLHIDVERWLVRSQAAEREKARYSVGELRNRHLVLVAVDRREGALCRFEAYEFKDFDQMWRGDGLAIGFDVPAKVLRALAATLNITHVDVSLPQEDEPKLVAVGDFFRDEEELLRRGEEG